MSAPWSPTPLALPAMTSSISVESTPVRCTIALRHWASSSCGWMWCRAPFCLPLPRGVRTPSMIQASRSWCSVSSVTGDPVAQHLRAATTHPSAATAVASGVHGRACRPRPPRRDRVEQHPAPHRAHRHPAQRRGAAAGGELWQPPRRDTDARVVLTSPLRRARDTCALAGFGDRAEVEPDLVEWDYGDGRGPAHRRVRARSPGWTVWTHDPSAARPSTTWRCGPTGCWRGSTTAPASCSPSPTPTSCAS